MRETDQMKAEIEAQRKQLTEELSRSFATLAEALDARDSALEALVEFNSKHGTEET